jgi:hypothetical protein
VEVSCRQQEKQLRVYFRTREITLHRAICVQDRNYTPLQLSTEEYVSEFLNPRERMEKWRTMELHGRFANELHRENIDRVRSTEWLRMAGFFGETEGFIFAIQDQVIHARGYEKHIMGKKCSDKCRFCKHATESIQNISCGCPSLARKDYLERHNYVAKVVHQALAKEYELIDTEMPHYKCKPEQVLSNNRAKLLWDTPFVTDRAVESNRPDLVLFDKQAKTATIIDIAVPLDTNIESTIAEKK